MLTGCGEDELSPEAPRPVAYASGDRMAFVGERVELVGAGADPEGDPLRFQWSMVSRPEDSAATLEPLDAPRTSFTADLEGDYLIQLVVRDEMSASDPSTVLVIVEPPPNAQPIADAGPDRAAVVGDTVTLDGAGSFDPDREPITYSWTVVDRPALSASELTSSTEAETMLVVDVVGRYRVQLVVNDGVQDGPPVFVQIVAVAAASGTGDIVSLPANGLVADPGRGVLYVSVPSTSPVSGTGNSVVTIDPATATITQTLFVGSEPGPLALSDDAQYLYVGLLGSFQIRRIDLTTFTAEPAFTIPWGRGREPRNAGPMAVLPGSPGTVVVSTRANSVPSFGGVVVFDSGVARPEEAFDRRFSASRLVGGVGNTFYGYNHESDEFGFYVLTVDAMGLSFVSVTRELIDGFDTDIIYDDGWVIATRGQAIDVSGPSPRRVGTFAASGLAVAADPTRVYFITSDDDYDPYAFVAFDRTTFIPVGEESTLALYGREIEGEPADLVRWGANGLAFRTQHRLMDSNSESNVYIFTSDLVVP